jgi:hypothetical protein
VSKRQSILDEVKRTIENIVDANNDAIFKYVGTIKSPLQLDTIPLPSVFYYSDKEVRLENDDRSVIGKENWEWYVTLEVWAQDKDMEKLLEWIHEAMYANYRLGNYAEWSERMGVDFFVIDPTEQLQAMVIPYKVIYRHDLGNM